MFFNDVLIHGLLNGWLEKRPQNILSAEADKIEWKKIKEQLREWIVYYDNIRVRFKRFSFHQQFVFIYFKIS